MSRTELNICRRVIASEEVEYYFENHRWTLRTLDFNTLIVLLSIFLYLTHDKNSCTTSARVARREKILINNLPAKQPDILQIYGTYLKTLTNAKKFRTYLKQSLLFNSNLDL